MGRASWRTLFALYSATALIYGGIVRGDSGAVGEDGVVVINAKTDLRKAFECSRMRPIGGNNEFYVTCTLKAAKQATLKRIELRDVQIQEHNVYDTMPFHVELELALNASSVTTIQLVNSGIHASAVRLEAASVSVDSRSSVNVSARGLKFGPGYNSWFNMGGSYGGIGGASFANDGDARCDDVPPLDFFRAIGDVEGAIANFQGYGSGGGDESSRGGGRVHVHARLGLALNGSLVANGGPCQADSPDSAGSGGTVLVEAGHLSGSGTIQANGGDPVVFDATSRSGGGGGGGGGRVVLRYEKLDDLNPTQLQAHGGGVITTTDSKLQWCQLGGDGTILKVQQSTILQTAASVRGGSDAVASAVGTLILKGRRADHGVPAKPIQAYGCTPIFSRTSRGESFLPDSVAQLFVTGGATLCTNYVTLKASQCANVSTTSSLIEIEAGSSLTNLDGNRTVTIGAAHVSLQNYVGPVPQTHQSGIFSLRIEGGDVTLANAHILVDKIDIDAKAGAVVDKYTVLKFQRSVSIVAGGDIQVLGFLQPDGDSSRPIFDRDDPTIKVSSKQSAVFTPQTAQIGALRVNVRAKEDATIDLPFETPFLILVANAGNLAVPRVSGGAMRECKSIEDHANPHACSDLSSISEKGSPYLMSFFATSSLTLGNVTSGSVIACSDGIISVEGYILADKLGCGTNSGPGKSSIAFGASGGAGHGGKGGNVEPGEAAGGKEYDHPSHMWPTLDEKGSDPPLKWPIWPGSGAASGDGSGEIAGGSGGGMVYIGAKELVFSEAIATISARGGAGSKSGGGGAGGAISFFVGEIIGLGLIDVSGGDSIAPSIRLNETVAGSNESIVWKPEWFLPGPGPASKSGGGGGGGIIRTFFRGDDPKMAGNGDNFVKSGGKLAYLGGKGHGAEDGGIGVTAATNCSAGRGGSLCLQCEEGTFSPPTESKCMPCGPGSYSDKKGVQSCSKCAAGSFNDEFGKKACHPCAAGTFAKATASKKCTPCIPGSFAGKPGSAFCSLCPVGSISINAGSDKCSLCGIGETTVKPGALHCDHCTNKPEHASFNMAGNCTYACEKGRNGLDCLTPFERFVKPIGGVLGFIVLLATFTSTIFGSWGFITYRNSMRSKQRFATYKAQTLRDELSLTNLTQNLTPRLTDQDLVGHISRLYFDGDNHLVSSWSLNPYVIPIELKDLVRDDAYASFATACNNMLAWPSTGWEFWVHRFLLLVVPPASTLFLRRRQLWRVEHLVKYVTQNSGGFVRGMSFRVHGAQLKVGFSPDFSLAYIDVIGSTTSSLASQAKQTCSDTIIVVAGSGSFFRPYQVDTNDVLVRSVPSRLELLQHQFWIDFVAEINQWLRLIPQPNTGPRTARATHAILDILDFVAQFNKRNQTDGVTIAFGTLTTQFDPLDGEYVQPRLDSYALEPFKFAFHVSKKAPEVAGGDGIEADTLSREPASTTKMEAQVGIESDPRPVEFRYSQIRMEALFEPTPSEAGESEPLHPEKPRRSSSRAISTVSDLLLCSSSSGSFQWLSIVLQPVAPIFRLQNVRPRSAGSSLALPFVMLLLVVLDVVICFWVLMEFYCVQVLDPTAHDSGCSRVAFASTLSVLPMALTGSPIVGLVFLSRKSVFYGKLFAVWNAGSIVNLVVALVSGLWYIRFVHEAIFAVIAGGIVLKVIEKEIALFCIAQYTVERPLRGWRGLHTTKDWYDAAYTPLIHQER